MDYFKLNEIQNYAASIGKKYESNSAATNWYLDTRNKLEHLVKLLGAAMGFHLLPSYDEKPNKQAGQGKGFVLREYVLLGFTFADATPLEHVFIKLVFHNFENAKCVFAIEVDIDFKNNKDSYTQYLGARKHLKKDRDQIQKDTYWETAVDETFPSDWETLVDLILPKVKEDVKYLRTIRKLSPDQVWREIENPTQNIMPSINTYSPPLNQILYGPPGTGKTYNTINKAIEIIEPHFDFSQGRKKVKEKFDELCQAGRIVFTTFHQSMSYEDFVEGIKPLKPEDTDNFVRYDVMPGIFKTICEKAKAKSIISNNFENAYASLLMEIKNNNGSLVLESLVHAKEFTIYENSKGNLKFHANTEKAYEGVILKEVIKEFLISGNALDWPSYTKAVAKHLETKHKYSQVEKEDVKPYILIIDEINRGNVSQIFGELITLLETDKRMGNDEALEVTLPYSKDLFSVPSNLYIVGTMNTADRSVEALDSALRRRFSFVEMPPKTDLPQLQEEISGIKLSELLETINRRIEKLLDKDHLIGHSYFLNISNLGDLQNTFYRNIIPLLQEYFFGDFGKIGLVLGSGFVELVDNQKSGVFADFREYEDFPELDERRIYRIKKEIDLTEEGFKSALGLLLNKQI